METISLSWEPPLPQCKTVSLFYFLTWVGESLWSDDTDEGTNDTTLLTYNLDTIPAADYEFMLWAAYEGDDEGITSVPIDLKCSTPESGGCDVIRKR